MNNIEITSELTDLFTQTLQCAQQLHDCLLLELDYLKNTDSKNLINNSLAKDALMNDLMDCESKRKAIIKTQAIQNKEDYLIWLAELDASSALKNQWQAVSDAIQACQQLNTTNGIISDKMATSSEQVLNILSGNNNATQNSTYTADGKKPDSKSSLHSTTA